MLSNMEKGKIIIISAPSGCGKSTIINALLKRGEIDMQFSVSATNRPPRDGEVHGVNYYFLTDDDFKKAISQGDFVEYEEVYPGRYYGTLKSEIARIVDGGQNVVLDMDVKGGVYGARAEFEIGYAPQFDHTVVNDDLTEAIENVSKILKEFTCR